MAGSFGNVSNILNLTAAAAPTKLRAHPFLKGCPAGASSAGAATLYGVNHPGDGSTTKYARWTQTISGNKAFVLPSAVTAPLQSTSAITAAQQLRVIVMVDGVTKVFGDCDTTPASGGFNVPVGGGTAVADATVIVKGTTAANIALGATSLSVASTGADTQTILIGDQLTIAGDSTIYYCTEASQALNGTTEVLVDITPPLQAAATASAVITVTTSDDRTILLNSAPAVGAKIEALVMDAADITQLTGGTMTATREYEIAVYDFMCAGVADVQISRLAR